MKATEFEFLFFDNQKNLLDTKIMWCNGKTDAVKMANNLLANCMDDDITIIKTRKKK